MLITRQISIAPQFGIRDEHIHHIGMSLHHELIDANVVGRLHADSLAKVLAMQLVRRYSYLERAKKLLSDTDLRIADIALRTGFASQSHFTSTFRKLVWTTPKAFRDSL
jgi:AraC-like DNA-binding protein